MIAWIFIITLLTPWFWSWTPPLPRDFFDAKLTRDLRESRAIVDAERSKIAGTPVDSLFSNWQKEFLSLRLKILMENLDIGNYFFAGHPRERVGVAEKQKFFFFQFILFALGFASPQIKKYVKFLIIYTLGIFFASFVFGWRDFKETILFSVPLILIMAVGLKFIFSRPHRWRIIFSCLAILEIAAFVIFKTKGFMQ